MPLVLWRGGARRPCPSSSALDATRSPSREKATERIRLPRPIRNRRFRVPSEAPQRMSCPPLSPVHKRRLSAEKATLVTSPRSPVTKHIGFWSCTSPVSSSTAQRHSPLPLCCRNQHLTWPLRTSHTHAVPSALALAINLPSQETATESTARVCSARSAPTYAECGSKSCPRAPVHKVSPRLQVEHAGKSRANESLPSTAVSGRRVADGAARSSSGQLKRRPY